MRWLARSAACAAALGLTAAGAAASSFGLADADRIAVLHAEGAQIYECRRVDGDQHRWALKEPVAALYDAAGSAGRHTAGPTWELADGTVLRARVVAKSPPAAQGAIPHLMLAVTSSSGVGLARARFILRLNTRGGVAPPACSQAGALLSVAYSADYAFYAQSLQD
ncbi:MAG: DUF3455 domain-containing protein [Hyphomicrobiaceae bacterium]|nr:DUF3455 domain-containing protein [Hyphomicrobiaceae bacterium]